MGKLFICATPIGNLGDTSSRLIQTLKDAGLIIAEDTRTLRKILARFAITKPAGDIISYQDYSSEAKLEHIFDRVGQTPISALVSESGLPLIQDPGYKIIRGCIERKIPVSIIPGPNAALSALVLSGLPVENFLFVGFLAKSGNKRKDKISEIAFLPYTLLFYESALRINKLLTELVEQLGNREAVIARELTKLHEEVLRGSFSSLINDIRERNLKGEIVLVVDGYRGVKREDFNEGEIKKEYIKLLKQNLTRKEVFKVIQSRYDIGRQKLYNITNIKKQ